jgi:exopolysaccharide biosynthesis WecB/TagA/CpsF family protein
MNLFKLVVEKLSSNTDDIFNAKFNIFLNPYSYLKLRKSPDISYVNEIYIDGKLLSVLFSLLLRVPVKRISFDNTSLAHDFFINCEIFQKKLSIIGSDMESSKRFNDYVCLSYPKLDIKIIRDGYFKEQSEIDLFAKKLIESQTEVLVVGMGSPLQEKFIASMYKNGWQGTAYTCGGFIHQTARSGYKYYPDFFDKYNFRFIYRIIDEPKLITRYIIIYPYAISLILIDALRVYYENRNK